jgi:hypothetical protein
MRSCSQGARSIVLANHLPLLDGFDDFNINLALTEARIYQLLSFLPEARYDTSLLEIG